MNKPLAGIRVLDFGQGGAGPYCTQLLGDYGADVIKVEPPRGDWGRTMGVLDDTLGFSGTYASMNRNKRGICLDLSTPEGRDIAVELALESDVLVESFRPGVMDRLQLGYESLKSKNSRLIYCSISAFGQSGPNAELPGSDSVIQPYGGLLAVNGEPAGEPMRLGNIVSDMLAAMNGFSGVLLALINRSTLGKAERVEVSLLDSIVAFQTTVFSEYLVTGKEPTPPGNRHPLLSTSGIVRAADGFLTVAVLDHYWEPFCRALKNDALLSDPRFKTSELREHNRDALWAEFSNIFAERSVDQWLKLLTSIGILCGPVNSYPEVVQDQQIQHNRMFGSTSKNGHTAPMVKSPIGLASHQATYGYPPALGEHTEEVLTEILGLDDAALESLRLCGATPLTSDPDPRRPE